MDAFGRHRTGLLVLDVPLPVMRRLELVRRVRAPSNVLMSALWVKEAEHDKVEALDLGADDYVPKPFGMNEVLARIRVALRHVARVQTGTEPRFQAGPLEVDFAARRVLVNGQQVQLTPTEYELLKIFITHRGK